MIEEIVDTCWGVNKIMYQARNLAEWMKRGLHTSEKYRERLKCSLTPNAKNVKRRNYVKIWPG